MFDGKPTIISRKASNWVDRGEPALPTLCRVLAYFFERHDPAREPLGARPAAVRLWHIAKAALVRDFAERVLRGEIPANTPTPDRLGHWLAERLLTPEELARFEAEAADEEAALHESESSRDDEPN